MFRAQASGGVGLRFVTDLDDIPPEFLDRVRRRLLSRLDASESD